MSSACSKMQRILVSISNNSALLLLEQASANDSIGCSSVECQPLGESVRRHKLFWAESRADSGSLAFLIAGIFVPLVPR